MLLEIAKPVALLLCLLSLFGVFHSAFMAPNASELIFSDSAQTARIIHTLWLLVFATGICLAGGLIFRESAPHPRPSLKATLPVQILCWASSVMLVLYLAAWYLETHVVFYRAITY
jgi:hypothetical protein